jgi:hypothetical protein
MDDLQHREEVDRETTEYWGGSNIESISSFRDLFKLFLIFQVAPVEQEVCSDILYTYLFLYLFVVPGIELRTVHMYASTIPLETYHQHFWVFILF